MTAPAPPRDPGPTPAAPAADHPASPREAPPRPRKALVPGRDLARALLRAVLKARRPIC